MNANTTAHDVRGTSTPEQDRSNADALSLKLYRLVEIVRLAAYAGASGMDTKEADTSEVLYYVADEMQAVNGNFTQAIYDLARAKKGGAA